MARFKKSEWQYGMTKQILADLLKAYYKSFNIEIAGWKKADIEYFLGLHHWAYRGPFAKPHHYHTCESIIKELAT